MAKGTNPAKSSLSAQIKQAAKLYEAGDVLSARREAQRVLESSPSESQAAEARALLERSQVPKMALYLALIAGATVTAMVLLAIAHH